MFPYFGSKRSAVDLYPPPVYDKIIEPFAGAATYSLKHFEKDITIVDKYEVIIKIFKWLQICTERDILSLPRLKEGDRVSDYSFDCEEARLLYGLCFAAVMETKPRDKISRGAATYRPNRINFHIKDIASNLYKIRHWKIINGSYDEIQNTEATWFIDPPYQTGGSIYAESNKNISYVILGNWCRSRQGQVIVCENESADWMKFERIRKTRNVAKSTIEAMWTNRPDIGQQSLFC